MASTDKRPGKKTIPQSKEKNQFELLMDKQPELSEKEKDQSRKADETPMHGSSGDSVNTTSTNSNSTNNDAPARGTQDVEPTDNTHILLSALTSFQEGNMQREEAAAGRFERYCELQRKMLEAMKRQTEWQQQEQKLQTQQVIESGK